MRDENLSEERRYILESIYESKKRPPNDISPKSSQLESDRVKRERNS